MNDGVRKRHACRPSETDKPKAATVGSRGRGAAMHLTEGSNVESRDQANNLSPARQRDGVVRALERARDVGEIEAIRGREGARETEASLGHDDAKGGGHRQTAVLDLRQQSKARENSGDGVRPSHGAMLLVGRVDNLHPNWCWYWRRTPQSPGSGGRHPGHGSGSSAGRRDRAAG